MGGQDRIHFCKTPSELMELLADTPDVNAVLTELRDRAGIPTTPIIAQIGQSYPTLPIIAFAAFCRDEVRSILVAGRAGLWDVVLTGFEDVTSVLHHAVSQRQLVVDPALLSSEVPAVLPPVVRRVILTCLTRGGECLTVQQLAHIFGVHRRTLAGWMRTWGFPPAGSLIAWGRLLAAAHQLEDPRRSIEAVALELTFSSASALDNMSRRYTGLTPSQIRRAGGTKCVLDAFRTWQTEKRGRR